jgi:rSAM/selenodomain-associated transferase 2
MSSMKAWPPFNTLSETQSVPERSTTPALSVVIPTLNEGGLISICLNHLADLRSRGAEIIVVDGGSSDDTIEQARRLCDAIVCAPRGRASQMNAGARAATGAILLFLHADTTLPKAADALVCDALSGNPSRMWGRFDVHIEGCAPLLRLVAWAMSVRSRLTGLATGDQAIFCRRDDFASVGGFPDIPIMEDIAFSKQIRRRARPLCLKAHVITSGRRWETRGVGRTILLMWCMRLAYALGVQTETLARWYRYGPVPTTSKSDHHNCGS